MIQAVQRIERSIKERRENDVALTNFWAALLFFTNITCGIYTFFWYFKRIKRVDNFILRKNNYYNAVIEYTEKYAEEHGSYDTVINEINDLKDYVRISFLTNLKPIKAGMSLFLGSITIGIYALFVLYRENKIWYDLQVAEQEFDDKLSQIWTELGILKYPINFKIDMSKNRNFAFNVVLTILTCGIWGIYWFYKIHTDPENLYSEFHTVEDTVLQTVRNQ